MTSKLKSLFLLRYAIVVLFLCATFSVFGQEEVTIQGVIIDEHSKEPVPFANVYLQSNPIKGVSADFNGVFEITFKTPPDILEISALGYETYVWKYDGNPKPTIQLTASALNLAEIVVTTKGEDPAYGIMRKVIKNKAQNNRTKLPAYSCEVYNKMEVDLINISEEFKNMKLNKPFGFVFDHIDSTSGEEPFLPLFVSEAISNFYFQQKPKKTKEQIKAIKIVGDYQNESVGQLLGIAEAQLNAYDNWIDLVSKKFAGPVSDNGTMHYRYYLIDTAFIDNQWCYQIQYFPKHKGVNGFYGDLWVHDSTFAIKKIKLQLLEESHLNFVEKLSIIQEYQWVQDSIWMPKKDHIVISSTTITEPFLPPVLFKKLRNNAPGIQAVRHTSYRHYGFDKDSIAHKIAQDIKVLPGAFKKDEKFWDKHRHVSLSASEQTAYFLIDTIKNLPVIEAWEKVTSTLFTGYLSGKYFDVGNFYEFISNNDIEGFRTKVGLRTDTGIHRKMMMGAYAAYGWGDRKWKYGADLFYLFRKSPRKSLGLAYFKDFVPKPNFKPYFSLSGDGVGSSYFLRRDIPFKLVDVEIIAANYYNEWKSGFSIKLSALRQHTNPLFPFSFKENDQKTFERYQNAEASIELRFAYKELFVSGSYARSSLGSKYPVVALKYSKSFKGLFGSDLEYSALTLNITDKIRWGTIGYTRTHFTAGKSWGLMPYLQMFIPRGNEGYVMNLRGFNSVAEYTFAMDRFAFISFDHHFDGFILQVIPLFRKMRLRSIANFRAIIGDMSAKNKVANAANLFDNTISDSPVRIRIPNKEPFMETSIGIENIFRFFRIDAIWRLNYKEIQGKRFGIRGSIHFAL